MKKDLILTCNLCIKYSLMATSELFIRRASQDDTELIIELGARTFLDAFGLDNNPEDMEKYITSAFNPAQIASELSDPASIFLLAYIAEKPVGYAKLQADEAPDCVRGFKPIELVRIYVEQGVMGKGYGAALMKACIEEAWQMGYETLWLGVWEYNERAQIFYRKWGFIQVGSKKFMIGSDVQQDLVMARSVKP